MVWTRGNLQHPALTAYEHKPLLRGGTQPLRLPALGYAMDPSDPRTWRRPVVFTR